MATNRLARLALTLNQYDYTIDYRKTSNHGKADALSRSPIRLDNKFDEEEEGEDIAMVSSINLIVSQLNPTDPSILKKEIAKDPVRSTVMRYMKEGWPKENNSNQTGTEGYSIKGFRKLEMSLSTDRGCLLYSTRVIIPLSLQRQVPQLLHIGHFGMQGMRYH